MEITIDEIKVMAEDEELEAKKAGGSDGTGELPGDFFETYSSMANTNGGVVFLGIEENPKGVFTPSGMSNPAKVTKQL